MEETYIASWCLSREIYVFNNKLTYKIYVIPCSLKKLDRKNPPICILFKGCNFNAAHF